MASPFASRTPADPVPTLAIVFDIVKAHPKVPRRGRQDMLSALRSAGRVLLPFLAPGANAENPLEWLPAHPGMLARLYRRVAPLTCGISGGRWANVRSLVHSAIGLALETAPGRHRNPLLPAWRAKMSLLPGKKGRS